MGALSVVPAALASGNPCADIFETSPEEVRLPSAEISDTENIIAYLEKLSEEQIIRAPEITRFRDALADGRVVNPITEEDTATKTTAMIHSKTLQSLLDEGTLDLSKLLAWSEAALQEKARVRVRREETRVETKDLYYKIKLRPVPAGEFTMGEDFKKVSVTLTHPFEMMTSAITQNQWAEIMGANPSSFIDGPDSETRLIQGETIQMRPNHPVENVTWWSVIVFANRLSEEHGLKPAYDLSGIKFKPGTSAEGGTLESEDPKANPVINAPEGDIYRAEGYRLPTEAERERAARAATDTKYSFGDDEKDLKDYGWFSENSNDQTHEVQSLKPNAYGLSDLHGNVWEWGHDWYEDNPKGGIDPKGPATGPFRVLRGGSWRNVARLLRSAYRGSGGPGYRNTYVGARLVRTRL